MPQAIAVAAAAAASNALAAAGATVATQALVASAVATTFAFAAPIAISIGASVAANALLGGRPQVPRPSDGQQEFQQSIPPRMFHYGRVKVSGPLGFYEDWRSGGVVLKHVLLSAREIDAVEEHILDDQVVTIEPTLGEVTNAFLDGNNRQVRVISYVGTDTQPADPLTLELFPPPFWTSAHQNKGNAYTVIFAADASPTEQQKTFPHGIPAYKALIRASKVYDPRKDSTVAGGSGAHRHANKATWEWSENAALCTLDYLTHADGYAHPISRMHLPSWRAKANLDDESVPLKAGGTEPRYRVATTVYLNEARKSVLARLLEAADARLYATSDGKIGVRGGAWTAPTVTLDADAGHIIEAEFSDGMPALDRYSELAIKYMSPAHGFTEVEAPAWRDAALVAEAGGVVETRPLDLLQVPSMGQARRLAKIRIARDNPRWLGEIRTNYYGLDAINEDKATLAWSELDVPPGNFTGPFWIEGDKSMMSDGTGASMRVRSASAASYAWDAATEEGDAPGIPTIETILGAGGADMLGAGGSDYLAAA